MIHRQRIELRDEPKGFEQKGRTRVYVRCNSGHYFSTSHCPLDGWSSPESFEVAAAVEQLAERSLVPTVDALRLEGVSDEALKRTIVVEFGSEESAFDAVVPEGYVIAREWKRLIELPQDSGFF